MNPIPDETSVLQRPENALKLFNTFSLSLLAQYKYLALLFDEEGRMVWAANSKSHTFKEIQSSMSSGPVSDFFDIPEGAPLGALFAPDSPHTRYFPSVPEETAAWVRGLLGPVPALSFVSRNRFEAPLIGANYLVSTPLSFLTLFRLSEKVFLGVVSLSELFLRLTADGGKSLVIVNQRREILGLSDPLISLLELSSPSKYLRRPLSDLMRLDNGPASVSPANLVSRTEWRAPGDFGKSIRVVGPAPALSKEALCVDNRGSVEYAWILPRIQGFFTEESFECVVEFYFDGDSHFPNCMMKADIAAMDKPARFPDRAGYNLSCEPGTRTFLLKKGGGTAREYSGIGPDPGAWNRFTVRKAGASMEWRLNNQSIGVYTEFLPFPDPSGVPILFFLRPGHRLLLRSITISSAPEGKKTQEPGRALASAGRHRLSVVSHTTLRGPEPVEVLEFGDVTRIEDRIRDLEAEKGALLAMLRPEAGPVAVSATMAAIFGEIPRIARSGITVLIEGETGSGKEVAARAIHDASERREEPFVKIDCTTIPESLMEAELFGYEKGAFTGALSAREGRFEQAQGGTVFLDEIAGIPLSTQAKLLTVLQDRRFQKLGGERDVELDIRIIAASNRPLDDLVAKGLFREDLYYRLNQMRLKLPPLRERFEDLPILAQRFIDEGNRLYAKSVKGLSPSALKKLLAHPWPGNVRQLRNVLLKAVLLSSSKTLNESDVQSEPGRADLNRRRRPTRAAFCALLTEEQGNLSEVAKRMGMGRQSVYRYLEKFKLKAGDFRKWE